MKRRFRLLLNRSVSTLLLLTSVWGSTLAFQDSIARPKEHELGLDLYRQGKLVEAAKQLEAATKKDAKDWEAWYYLGLAQASTLDMKKALKAFDKAAALHPEMAGIHASWSYALYLTGKKESAEREATLAIKLNSKRADAHCVLSMIRLDQRRYLESEAEADAAIDFDPQLALSYFAKSQALIADYGDDAPRNSSVIRASTNPPTDEEREQQRVVGRQRRELLKKSADALETYLKLANSEKESQAWREQLETLRAYSTDKTDEPKVFTGAEVLVKAHVLTKPEPTYTESARQAGIEGTVLLQAVFTSGGTVEHILVLRSLPFGMTERCVAAAKKIKFVPATKDEKPVSMFMRLEYNFHLY